VQLLLGDKDQMTSPKTTAELVRLLKADVRRLQAGHNLMAEAPDGVLNALKAFLSSPPKEVAA
jgi:pimeloyl-ACP methyl ester carboxylesterase